MTKYYINNECGGYREICKETFDEIASFDQVRVTEMTKDAIKGFGVRRSLSLDAPAAAARTIYEVTGIEQAGEIMELLKAGVRVLTFNIH